MQHTKRVYAPHPAAMTPRRCLQRLRGSDGRPPRRSETSRRRPRQQPRRRRPDRGSRSCSPSRDPTGAPRTRVASEPRSDGSAQLIKFEVEVPCGVILQESDDAGGRPIVVVGAVGEGSNAEAAGLRPGDILRATSAVRQQMEMPTWQLLGGGIGRPKTFRFIFGADLDAKPARDFEEVLGAVGSNRLDPQGRPAILVVEIIYLLLLLINHAGFQDERCPTVVFALHNLHDLGDFREWLAGCPSTS